MTAWRIQVRYGEWLSDIELWLFRIGYQGRQYSLKILIYTYPLTQCSHYDLVDFKVKFHISLPLFPHKSILQWQVELSGSPDHSLFWNETQWSKDFLYGPLHLCFPVYLILVAATSLSRTVSPYSSPLGFSSGKCQGAALAVTSSRTESVHGSKAMAACEYHATCAGMRFGGCIKRSSNLTGIRLQ